MNEVTAVCQECGKQFEYVLKEGFPRKYCFDCSAKKKASFEAKQTDTPIVEKPGKVAQSVPNGQAAMYVSYAKDLFLGLDENIPVIKRMELATGLIKQAKEAFSS